MLYIYICTIILNMYHQFYNIRQDLEATLVSYKVLLKLLTKTFLLDDDLPEFKANNSLKTAIDSHRASFTSLQKSLQEAKLEVIWNRDIRGCTKEYDAVVKSMQHLAQSMGGLRSSCGLQFELLQQDNQSSGSSTGTTSPKRKNKAKTPVKKAKKRGNKETWNIRADHNRRKLEGEIKRQKNSCPHSDGKEEDVMNLPNHQSRLNEEADGTLIEFIHTIRQPLKSLAYTCKQTILHLQNEFSSRPHTGPGYEILKNNLIKAIALFEVSQRQAVKRLNRHRLKHLQKKESFVPREDVFLVYFFVFNMMEFARELIPLVESVRALSLAKEKKRTLFSLIVQLFKRTPLSKASNTNSFIPNERHKMDTLHTPLPKTKWRQMVLRVWKTFSLFKLQKIRYAIKATGAVILLATPAFLDSTGDWFREWRMEWALITVGFCYYYFVSS